MPASKDLRGAMKAVDELRRDVHGHLDAVHQRLGHLEAEYRRLAVSLRRLETALSPREGE